MFNKIREFLIRTLRIKVQAKMCGHQSALCGTIFAHNESTGIRMPFNNEGTTDWCLDCIAKMTIQCASCGNPIWIGSPIALIVLDDSDKIPFHAVLHEGGFVNCLRGDCADPCMRSGFWLPQNDGHGHVFRVPSPLELCLGGQGSVVVSDIGSIEEAVRAGQR